MHDETWTCALKVKNAYSCSKWCNLLLQYFLKNQSHKSPHVKKINYLCVWEETRFFEKASGKLSNRLCSISIERICKNGKRKKNHVSHIHNNQTGRSDIIRVKMWSPIMKIKTGIGQALPRLTEHAHPSHLLQLLITVCTICGCPSDISEVQIN